ncbi:MAG: hypothetical protein ACKO68_07380 [Bacteroidota bacterium]
MASGVWVTKASGIGAIAHGKYRNGTVIYFFIEKLQVVISIFHAQGIQQGIIVVGSFRNSSRFVMVTVCVYVQ